MRVSVVIPTFNGARKIGSCLQALARQETRHDFEMLVVDDGSTDNTAEVVRRHADVRLIRQANAGPAAARNRGAREASGDLILFTDDDCEPLPNWIDELVRPFEADPEVVGAKGTYLTRQTALASRFVQLEYESRYGMMAGASRIDFIDTYSAAFRRAVFLAAGGYDPTFPVACAEDVELSFRLAAKGLKMVYAPQARVYHLHPESFFVYLKRKYRYAYWRMLALAKHPRRAAADSHTPQLMKFQLLAPPALAAAAVYDTLLAGAPVLTLPVLLAFLASCIPFMLSAARKDPLVGLLSPLVLLGRSGAQFLGVVAGTANVYRTRKERAVGAGQV